MASLQFQKGPKSLSGLEGLKSYETVNAQKPLERTPPESGRGGVDTQIKDKVGFWISGSHQFASLPESWGPKPRQETLQLFSLSHDSCRRQLPLAVDPFYLLPGIWVC